MKLSTSAFLDFCEAKFICLAIMVAFLFLSLIFSVFPFPSSFVWGFFFCTTLQHPYDSERLDIVITEKLLHLQEYSDLRKENISKNIVVLLSVTLHCRGSQVCDITMLSTEIATLLPLRPPVCFSS